MSKSALVISLASILSFPAVAEDLALEGTYKLIGSTRKILDSGQVVDSYGRQPSGYINYGRDGRVLVLIVSDNNDRPAPANVSDLTDEQRANLFRTMVAYGGTYECGYSGMAEGRLTSGVDDGRRGR